MDRHSNSDSATFTYTEAHLYSERGTFIILYSDRKALYSDRETFVLRYIEGLILFRQMVTYTHTKVNLCSNKEPTIPSRGSARGNLVLSHEVAGNQPGSRILVN